jgi:hypothetical protein
MAALHIARLDLPEVRAMAELFPIVTRNLASNASRVMAEASRRGDEAVSRAEQQTSRRQQRAEV